MKISHFATALLFGRHLIAQGVVPEPLPERVRADFKAAMQTKDPQVSAERIAQEIAAFEKNAANSAGEVAVSFTFTVTKLAGFQNRAHAPTEEEMQKSVAAIKNRLTNPTDLPHL